MSLYPNSVAWSLFTTLSSDSALVSSGVTVRLNEPLNSDPNLQPWLGVYAGEDVVIEPHRIGGGNPRRATYTLSIYAQVHGMEGGQLAVDALHRLITPVIAAVKSNDTLDGTVDMITTMRIEPYQRAIDEEDWMFSDLITLNAEVDV